MSQPHAQPPVEQSAAELLAAPHGQLHEVMAVWAREKPDALAIADPDGTINWGDLVVRIDSIAAQLQADGLQAGQAVGIVGASGIDYALAFLGAVRAGGCAAPLTTSAAPGQIAAMLKDSGAIHLFLDRAKWEELQGVELPPVKLVSIGQAGVDGVEPLTDWARADPATIEERPLGPKSCFNIIYSSGTTGTPKGIVQPADMRWSQIAGGRGSQFNNDTVAIASTPLYSNTTLVMFLPVLGQGGAVVIMPKFDARGFLELAERHRATHAMLVPVQYTRLMADPEFDRFDLSSFVAKYCTSAPCPAELKRDIVARWPGLLVEYYGMTEGGGSTMLLCNQFPDKLHTVGRPLPGHEMFAIDADGNRLGPNEKGEVVGRSGAMMNEYKGRPDATRDAEWRDADGNRYIRTGDIGAFDADGFLTLMGRAKDMIISGGFNIYPGDLEDALLALDNVADAAVVGIASEQWGETPVAFVVPVAGSGPTGEDIRAAVNAGLGKTQRLSAVHVVDDLPRSHIGKLLKRELRETAEALGHKVAT